MPARFSDTKDASLRVIHPKLHILFPRREQDEAGRKEARPLGSRRPQAAGGPFRAFRKSKTIKEVVSKRLRQPLVLLCLLQWPDLLTVNFQEEEGGGHNTG